MKKNLLLLFLFASFAGSAQKMNQEERNKGLISQDTVAEKLQHVKDSVITGQKETMDSIAIIRDFNPNLNYLVQLQKEQKAKQKKAALMRIGIGVVFLIILIIGLRRKRVIRQ